MENFGNFVNLSFQEEVSQENGVAVSSEDLGTNSNGTEEGQTISLEDHNQNILEVDQIIGNQIV